jgi:hypothetical protein
VAISLSAVDRLATVLTGSKQDDLFCTSVVAARPDKVVVKAVSMDPADVKGQV